MEFDDIETSYFGFLNTIKDATVPESVAKAITPLLRALPLERAMPDLVVTSKADQQSVDWVSSMVGREPIEGHGGLIAGLWLSVDLLDYSHRISQSMDEPTGAYWHGIMHRREGDFSNAKYWFHQASGHPAIGAVQSQAPSYDPAGFVASSTWRIGRGGD